MDKDFIPADQDPGAYIDGFRDFVPAREPVLQEEVVAPTYKELQAKAKELGLKTVGVSREDLEQSIIAGSSETPEDPQPSEPEVSTAPAPTESEPLVPETEETPNA